jgi:hypothetical protein
MINHYHTKRRFRENIVTLKDNHPHEFGKFIMALKNLEESDDWARICGIHGNTFKPNDPHVLCPTDPKIVEKLAKTGEPVYCAHSVEPFIAWHVPYLYEFEQLLNIYNHSNDKEYIALPYFDISQQDYNYSFLNCPDITILYNEETVTIRNPLASAYYYPNGQKTKISRNGIIIATCKKDQIRLKTVRRQLFNTLHAKTYEEFSSQVVSLQKTYKPYGYVPLETPHNSIHDIIGGDGGNMSDIAISAFDPIFWLHHCNMDRFFYNWLKHIAIDDATFSKNCLEATLAPFSKRPIFGWQNNKTDFILLKDVLDIHQYPYVYAPIVLRELETKSAYVDIIDIPIPPESVTIHAYLFPQKMHVTDITRNDWYAGAVSWFGLNRSTTYCNRCNNVRTNLKIDILDFINKYDITNENINDYKVFLECRGKLIKNMNGQYITYDIQDILQDGTVTISLDL